MYACSGYVLQNTVRSACEYLRAHGLDEAFELQALERCPALGAPEGLVP